MDASMASYTDLELQEIARWLREGLSASKIAAAFSVLRGSAVSRNAIIGIVHRNAMLGQIGFANGRGMITAKPPGGGPRSKPPAAPLARGGTPAKVAGMPAGARGTNAASRKPKPRPNAKARCGPPPAWLPPRLFAREVGVLIADGEAYRFKVPVPQRGPIGRQPHGVAMRFVDCLFGRCRAPLDLTVQPDPADDAPGGRPDAEMLCCGMRTTALKSYCGYHQARFQRRIFEAIPG
jgi:GcrA cell cycle regulator